jgi:serine/threonine-protein kinase RsbT
MSAEDLTEELLAALHPYFSAPIAKALLTTTVRRTNLIPGKLATSTIPTVVSALEQTLPSYITDPTRRGECVLRLRLLLAYVPTESAAPAPAPAPAKPAPPAMLASTTIHIRTHDDVVNASEAGRDLSRRVGFSEVDQTKIATASSELARNVLLYAQTGRLRISSLDAPRRGIEITTEDQGPGIADLALVMSNSYRSRTGMGMGLKGTKRLMDVFDIRTAVGSGTHVMARKFLP